MELSPEPRTVEVPHDLMENQLRRVLILEDDPALRRILWRTFAGWGWSAVAAASVEEAKLFTAENTAYDLVVSDYHLPDGTGLEFLNWALEQGVSAPFILMSADARMPFHSQVRRLQKPFSIDELSGLVESILGSKAHNVGVQVVNGTATAKRSSTGQSRKTN